MEEIQIKEPYKYERGYIYLPVSFYFSSFPDTINFSGNVFSKKDSFHVSLLYTPNIFSLVASDRPVDDKMLEQEILSAFNEYNKNSPIVFDGVRKEFRKATKGENQSIVICCEVKNLRGLFDVYKKIFAVDVPYQPAHVTLYTLIPNVGIGINSEKAMEKCPQINPPELDEAIGNLK